jgi:two-component system nitrogen regulation response regulator GlnG/two-component system response regulator HydG
VRSRPGTSPEDHQTTASGTGESGHSRLSGPLALTLVIAAHPHDPSRVGDLAIVPSDGSTVILGRGAPDDEPRMRLFRARPDRLEPAPPLTSPGLSRRQLELRFAQRTIGVRNVGRCPLRVNGMTCEAGSVSAGDTLSFRQELVLLCVERTVCPAPLRYWKTSEPHAFGAPDSAGIVGESPAIWRLRDEIAFAAMSGQHVLLVGQSGTGKELAARAVRDLSSRKGRPLVARNAATFPAGLIDAEMFGNVKNYPNPGMADRPGLIGQADGGFVFLDEIGELPADLQSHLLRVLDAGGEYQRLGESKTRRSDFRLLAATNRDPADLRQDLLARFAIRIELPPLSERREDIPLLTRHLLLGAAERTPELVGRFFARTPDGEMVPKIDAKFIDALLRCDYPGNARDLQTLLWKAIAASDGDLIAYCEAALDDQHKEAKARGGDGSRSRRASQTAPTDQEIRDALQREGGSVAQAAKALGLSSRYTLYRMLAKLRLTVDGSD